jgi:3-oxoacyl-[acyl-carrier protein] reductase
VTGATSGIGYATALLLGERGALVAACGRRADRLDSLERELGADRMLGLAIDIADSGANRRFLDATVQRFGRLDSFVASAGVGRYGGILDGSDEDLDSMIRTNVAGTVWGIRAAVPHLRAGGGGDVVIVASVAGLRGGANEAVYAATKFAQVGLAGAIDRELRTDGIRVTAMCPAAVATEFAIGAGRRADDPWLDEVLRPADVAAAIVAVLEQPRRLRTTSWSMWSMVEAS